MRSIVKKKLNPTYKLEKFMRKIYKRMLPSSDVSINSTRIFLQKIRKHIPQPGDYMLRLCVTNLHPLSGLKEMTKDIGDTIENNYFDSDVCNTR